MAKPIVERLKQDVVLGDGGYIVELERRGYVIAGAFTPELAITHPDAIREMHREMAKVLGKYQEQTLWTPNPDAPMSETEFNWERRQSPSARPKCQSNATSECDRL